MRIAILYLYVNIDKMLVTFLQLRTNIQSVILMDDAYIDVPYRSKCWFYNSKMADITVCDFMQENDKISVMHFCITV